MNKKLIILSCILILLFLSIGFSSLQKQLDINKSNFYVRIQEDIRVTNISVNNSSNDGESLEENYNINNISSTVYLPNQNSTITYHIEITNYGNVSEGISSINETYKLFNDGIQNTNSNLEIKNMTYTLGDKLCDDQNSNVCTLGSTSSFDITIGYKTNGYDGNQNHYILLEFEFNRVFNISYVGFNNTSNYPTTILDGETKTITFTTEVPTYLSVTNADSNYTEPTLTISNATDNITISYMCLIAYTNITTQNLQTQIVKGQDLSVTFTDPDIESLTITMNNQTLTTNDYTFVNNVLTIEDVKGNINITANKTQTPDYVITFTEENNQTEEQTTNVNVPVSDYVNQSFEYINNSGRTINSVTLEIVYTKRNSGNTSGQYLVGRLSYNGNSYLSNQVEIPKQSATEQTLLIGEFNNLSIPSNTNITFAIDLSNSNFSSTNITIISQKVTVTYAE